MAKQLNKSEPTEKRVRTPSKIRPVPIPQMRVPPALVSQRRFRQSHGDYLASHLDLDKLGYPIINHRAGIFWVCDGQHRIYALKQNGFAEDVVDCDVYTDLTDAEMAEIFLGRDDRRAISSFDKFHVACTAGREREADIRRIVEAQGVKISQARDTNCVGAVGSITNVYESAGAVVLGQVVRVIRDAFDGDPAAFDRNMIEAVGLVFNRYNGRTSEKALSVRLGETIQGVHGILRRAESQRERTGNQKSQCVAATLVEIYNKGASHKEKLPSWWKVAQGKA